jgi:MFS family permease
MAALEDTGEQVPVVVERSNRLLFRNRDYTGWWIGDTVSAYGTALSTVAYPLLILFTTGSATSAGVVAAAESIGGLVTMLIGGALADRVSRRAILVASPLVQAVVVGTVVVAVVTGHVYVSHVAAVGLIQGLVGGMAVGADFAALRRVVPEEMLPNAFALAQGRTWAIRLAGPSSGGLLFGVALVPNPWAIGALIAVTFVLIAPLNVVFGTYEARMIPDALMGRVSSAINFGASSIRWLGPLSAGALASAFSPSVATLVFAGVQAAVAVSTFVASGLHVLDRPIDEATAHA